MDLRKPETRVVRGARRPCTEKTDGSHSEPQDHEMVKRWHHDSIIAAAGKLE